MCVVAALTRDSRCELGSREMELLSEDNGDKRLPTRLHEFTGVGQDTK